MRLVFSVCLVVVIGLAMVGVGGADEPQRDVAVYVDKADYPVIDELDAANEKMIEVAKAKTEEILAAYREAEKMRTEPAQKLRFDISGIVVWKPRFPKLSTIILWNSHFLLLSIVGCLRTFCSSCLSVLQRRTNIWPSRHHQQRYCWKPSVKPPSGCRPAITAPTTAR